MNVLTHTVRFDGSSIAIGYGVDESTGDEVTFGGDWRPMSVLADVLEHTGEVLAGVEEWAILSRIHKEVTP